jgi:hypothetical protein
MTANQIEATAAAKRLGYEVQVYRQQGRVWDVRIRKYKGGVAVYHGYDRRRDVSKAEIGTAVAQMVAAKENGLTWEQSMNLTHRQAMDLLPQ